MCRTFIRANHDRSVYFVLQREQTSILGLHLPHMAYMYIYIYVCVCVYIIRNIIHMWNVRVTMALLIWHHGSNTINMFFLSSVEYTRYEYSQWIPNQTWHWLSVVCGQVTGPIRGVECDYCCHYSLCSAKFTVPQKEHLELNLIYFTWIQWNEETILTMPELGFRIHA